MLNTKRGEGTAFGWILALVTLLVCGILFIMLNQGLTVYVQPAFDNVKQIVAIQGQNLNSSQIEEIQSEENFYMTVWNFTPVIVFISVVIWVVLNAIKRNKEDMYQ